jgi:hypothetical protein
MVAFASTESTIIEKIEDPNSKALLDLLKQRSRLAGPTMQEVRAVPESDPEYVAEMAAWNHASDMALLNCEAWE